MNLFIVDKKLRISVRGTDGRLLHYHGVYKSFENEIVHFLDRKLGLIGIPQHTITLVEEWNDEN